MPASACEHHVDVRVLRHTHAVAPPHRQHHQARVDGSIAILLLQADSGGWHRRQREPRPHPLGSGEAIEEIRQVRLGHPHVIALGHLQLGEEVRRGQRHVRRLNKSVIGGARIENEANSIVTFGHTEEPVHPTWLLGEAHHATPHHTM